jgi:hypothetical protein
MSAPNILLFNITKRSPRPVNSLITPATGYPLGTAMQESATAGTAELADGSKAYAGFQTRLSQVGGPALGDVIYPGRLDLPFPTGDYGTYEFAEEVVAEGAQFIDASITAATALKTPLSFLAGKFAVASSGQLVQFELVEQQAPVVAGNVRIRAITCPGYVHA